MSLAKLKAKETKGKQKPLPKLKAILANPKKTKCPVLDDQELEHLKSLLKTAISESQLEPRKFATQKGICLGLESSLRKINNQSSSCVFISLSIKPNYLVGLIARNAEIKDETQPVYAQPKLESFIEELFGIQALCMVLPNNVMAISEDLHKWLEKRKKPAKVKKEVIEKKKPITKKTKKPKAEDPKEIVQIEKKEKDVPKPEKNTWSGDFISFGKDNRRQMNNLKLDGDEAVEALSEIMDKIPVTNLAKTKQEVKCEPMEVDSDKDDQDTSEKKVLEEDENSDNSDEFLGDYKALTVHKIKGNPNKKPKKKRKKNKKKNPVK